MSLTSIVPSGVPSLFNGSQPCSSSLAQKYTNPPSGVSRLSEVSCVPWSRLAFVRSTVPASVPSVTHTSRRPGASVSTNTLPLRYAVEGSDQPGPGSRSLTSVVPAAVPSVFHSSRPSPPGERPAKKTVPSASVIQSGMELAGANSKSATGTAASIRRGSSNSAAHGRAARLECLGTGEPGFAFGTVIPFQTRVAPIRGYEPAIRRRGASSRKNPQKEVRMEAFNVSIDQDSGEVAG